MSDGPGKPEPVHRHQPGTMRQGPGLRQVALALTLGLEPGDFVGGEIVLQAKDALRQPQRVQQGIDMREGWPNRNHDRSSVAPTRVVGEHQDGPFLPDQGERMKIARKPS